MTNHPVSVSWKNKRLFQEETVQELLAQFGGLQFVDRRFLQPITQFLEGQKDVIFTGEPTGIEAGEPAYSVTIDLKEIKEVLDAKGHVPLEVIHQKGHIVTMFLRPDTTNKFGLLFKLCPHEMICDHRRMISAAKRFNRSLWHLASPHPAVERPERAYDPVSAVA